MRTVARIFRWIVMVVGLIEILGNLVQLPDSTNQAANLAFIGVWLVVVCIAFYFEARGHEQQEK